MQPRAYLILSPPKTMTSSLWNWLRDTHKVRPLISHNLTGASLVDVRGKELADNALPAVLERRGRATVFMMYREPASRVLSLWVQKLHVRPEAREAMYGALRAADWDTVREQYARFVESEVLADETPIVFQQLERLGISLDDLPPYQPGGGNVFSRAGYKLVLGRFDRLPTWEVDIASALALPPGSVKLPRENITSVNKRLAPHEYEALKQHVEMPAEMLRVIREREAPVTRYFYPGRE